MPQYTNHHLAYYITQRGCIAVKKSHVFNRLSYLDTSRKVTSLEQLTLGQEKFKFSTGSFYEHTFNKRFRNFSKKDYYGYSDRKYMLEDIRRTIANRLYKVTALNGQPFKVHFFGDVIEVTEYEYLGTSRLIFDPTLMPEGKTESVLSNEYFQVLTILNSNTLLNIVELNKGKWIKVDIPNI